MITPFDKEYLETKRIILGEEKMNPVFVPLAVWIDETYGVKVINIIYDTFYANNPRLQICFEFEKEKNKFLTSDASYFNKNKQEAIAGKFKEFVEAQGLEQEYQTGNIFVIYGAFEPIAKDEVGSRIPKELQDAFIKSFQNEDIWTVSIFFTMPTFFTFTDAKVKAYDKPEIKKVWADRFYDLIKPFDEFNYFKREDIRVYVDSKENFDKIYNSNWYYYYK